MADITITAGNVISGSGSAVETGTANATITAGQPVYRASADSRFGLSDANSATAEVRDVYGIALNGASAGQPISVHKSGPLTIGATLVVGGVYTLSRTAGGICPVADLTTGDYVSVIGVATSASVLSVVINNSATVKP